MPPSTRPVRWFAPWSAFGRAPADRDAADMGITSGLDYALDRYVARPSTVGAPARWLRRWLSAGRRRTF